MTNAALSLLAGLVWVSALPAQAVDGLLDLRALGREVERLLDEARPADFRPSRSAAEQAHRSGDWLLVLLHADPLLEQDPRDGELWMASGMACARLHLLDRAERRAERLLQSEARERPETRYLSALIAFHRGHLALASSELARCNELRSRERLQDLWARVDREQREGRPVVERLEREALAEPSNPFVWTALADAYGMAGDLTRAWACLQRHAALRPEDESRRVRSCADVWLELLGDAPVGVLTPVRRRADRLLRALAQGGVERDQEARRRLWRSDPKALARLSENPGVELMIDPTDLARPRELVSNPRSLADLMEAIGLLEQLEERVPGGCSAELAAARQAFDRLATGRFQKAVDSVYAEIRSGRVRHARTIRTPAQILPTPRAPEDPAAIYDPVRGRPRSAQAWLEVAQAWGAHDDVARQWAALEAARHALDLQEEPKGWSPEWSWDQDPAVRMAELLPAWEGPGCQRDDGLVHGSSAARLAALTGGRFLEDFAGVRAAWQYALQWAPTAGPGRAGRGLQKSLLERAGAAGHSFPGLRAGWLAGTAETWEAFEPALEVLFTAAELELEPLRHEIDLAYERSVYEFGRSLVLNAENLAQREQLLREMGAAWETRLDALRRYDQARRDGFLDERAWLDAQQDFLRSTDEVGSRLAFDGAGLRFVALERTAGHSALLERVVRERLRVAIQCRDARVASQQLLELAHFDPDEPLDPSLRESVETIDPLQGLQSPAARDLAAQVAVGVEVRSLLESLVAVRDSFMLDVGARIVLARILRRAERPLDARLELTAALELAPTNRTVWAEWEALAKEKVPPADEHRAARELELWIETLSRRIEPLQAAWMDSSRQSELAHAKRSTAQTGRDYYGSRIQYDLARARMGAARVEYEWLGTLRSRTASLDPGLKW